MYSCRAALFLLAFYGLVEEGLMEAGCSVTADTSCLDPAYFEEFNMLDHVMMLQCPPLNEVNPPFRGELYTF